MNILAVDDEYFALELLKSAIGEVAQGASVFACRDVLSALDTAREQKIDVAFLDIHMPEKNGIELAPAALAWLFTRTGVDCILTGPTTPI